MDRQHAHDFDPTNGDMDEFPDPDAVGSRRALFGAAMTGFALATSGLLLPDWLVAEAEAADHPVRRIQHRADKRRQRKHHRLKQKRTQQRHQQGAADAPGVGLKIFRLSLVNQSDLYTIASLYTGTTDWVVGSDGTENTHINPGGTNGPFNTADRHAGFSFFNFVKRPFLWVAIPNGASPSTTMQTGGFLSRDGYQGGTTVVNQFPLGAGESVTKIVDFGAQEAGPKSYKVTVSREKDTPDAIVFTMTFANP